MMFLGPSRAPRRTRGLSVAVAVLLLLGIVGAIVVGPPGLDLVPGTGNGSATGSAQAFLARYEAPDGRVVRWDQGADTVSEGQAYAMLLAVATGDRGRFRAAWTWAETHLGRPDGLLSWHWQGGRVTDPQSAADGDVETAWALRLAAVRFSHPAYLTDAARLAAAVLHAETALTPMGAVLVAGPWARRPVVVDPSYLAPEAADALVRTSAGGGWVPLGRNDRGALAGLVRVGGHPVLPPDWAEAGGTGLHPTGGPGGSPAGARYGLDAERVPVLLAASCHAGDRKEAAALWPLLRSLADRGADVAYTLTGETASSARNPLGLVAAAAAAGAAGHASESDSLLDAAASLSGSDHTYYGDAWVALGRVLLTTRLLATCPPG